MTARILVALGVLSALAAWPAPGRHVLAAAVPAGVTSSPLSTLVPANPIGQAQASADDDRALMRAERAFAQTNQERGQRQAWLAWFAEDGVMFEPGPVNARKTMGEIQDSDAAPPGAFDWRPTIGLISRSGDLGFNAGPVRVGKGSPSSSSFFSIWRKQPGGDWRVVVDLGVPTDYKAHDPFDDRYVLLPPGPAATSPERATALETIEQSATSSAAFLEQVDDNSRGLRVGTPLLVGPAGFKAHVPATDVSMEPLGSGMSMSGDFGYTYGRYRHGGPNGEHGHYARAWRRNAAGEWRIIFDVMRRDR